MWNVLCHILLLFILRTIICFFAMKEFLLCIIWCKDGHVVRSTACKQIQTIYKSSFRTYRTHTHTHFPFGGIEHFKLHSLFYWLFNGSFILFCFVFVKSFIVKLILCNFCYFCKKAVWQINNGKQFRITLLAELLEIVQSPIYFSPHPV